MINLRDVKCAKWDNGERVTPAIVENGVHRSLSKEELEDLLALALKKLDVKNMNKKMVLSAIREYMKKLKDDERISFIDECLHGYCKLCGTSNVPCFCDPRYDE